MMKKLNMAILGTAALLAVTTVSCKKKGCTDETATNYNAEAKKDDGSCEYATNTNTNVVVSGQLTGTTNWTNDNIYELAGKVVIPDGAVLNIQAGTIIKGQEGTGTNASALIVARGGKINANGTASQPIIFTSVLDNIKVGEFAGTNLDETDAGLWGGVIVLGYAPVSAQDGDVLAQIEGLPTTETYGAYGGSDAADNSGTMTYVSIRHGGALIGAGNEINGLTLGGVGTGTTINNIEVVGNLDDGIEFFGGTVNVSNIVISFQGDDGIDIDQNYAGTVSNFIVVSGASSDESLEIDGPEGTTYTTGLFTLTNGNCYTYGGGMTRADYKSKAQGNTNNVKLGQVYVRASYQNDCADPKSDAFTYLTDATPKLTFNSTEFAGVTVYTASTDNAGTSNCTVFAADQTAAEGAMTSATAAGMSNSSFGWTWTSIKNKF